MFLFDIESNLSKPDFYTKLNECLKHLIEEQRTWVTNYSNASALLFHGLLSLKWFQEHKINWAGFYLVDQSKPDHLLLGPFQGKAACTRIKFGKGVCGTAAASGVTQVVANVHEFPGHIACDSASNSEIVVPIIDKETKRVLGVLDIDSEAVGAFSQEDQDGLEEFVRILVQGSSTPILS